jgi:hypothetical protein
LRELVSISSIWGHPYIDLERYLDLTALDAIDEEVSFGLTQVPLEYTGGSHRTLGIVPPSEVEGARYVDYGEVIARMSRAEFARFVALADAPGEFDLARQADYEFGEEKSHPLSRRQMLYLKFRHGVYFPWQVFYEMIPTLDWADKSRGEGKAFTPEAEARFPLLVAWVKRLPFAEIGRCNILGLEANHDGTIHQDGDLGDPEAEHFITVCPRADKRLFLWDEETRTKTYVPGRAYWFNDHGYHGVEADPYFRYSIRVDGVFERRFHERLRRDYGAPTIGRGAASPGPPLPPG